MTAVHPWLWTRTDERLKHEDAHVALTDRALAAEVHASTSVFVDTWAEYAFFDSLLAASAMADESLKGSHPPLI
jgi:hypothetical protein